MEFSFIKKENGKYEKGLSHHIGFETFEVATESKQKKKELFVCLMA